MFRNRRRQTPAERGGASLADGLGAGSREAPGEAPTPPQRDSAPVDDRCEIRFRVDRMDCPSCVAKIEGRLLKMDGVRSVQGSPVARTLTVEMDAGTVGPEELREAMGHLGYLAQALDEDSQPAPAVATWSSREARIAYGSALLFALALLLRFAGVDPYVASLPLHELHLSDGVLVLAALVGGWNFFPKGIRAARALALDMNFLMTIAILGAVGIGEYVEAAAIAFLFAFAELLESYSVDRVRASVESLMELTPDSATLLRDGMELRVTAGELVLGDVVLVRPGERIPVDGTVVEGASAVDQAPITGESLPVDKVPGDGVFAGTVNQEGYLHIRVDREAGRSTLARIVHLVEEAESRKTRTERFVERFARWYTPAVTIGALLVVAVPTLVFAEPFTPWFVRGLTLLVIACPCALVISTPVAVVSGITAAARNGVLIKGGLYLEAMAEVRAVALDKTGTLTFGHPEVVQVLPRPGVTEDDLLLRAAAVERFSTHPVAVAILEAAEGRGLHPHWEVTEFTSVTGMGARAELDGEEHRVGKPDLLLQLAAGASVSPPDPGPGRSVIGVSRRGEVLGWIVISDRPRQAAVEVLSHLRGMGVRRVVMLTGDARESAEAVGREIGVSDVRAELLPEDKLAAIKELEAREGSVAMVGDGVNDAPALAAATVGIAMGAAGSDTALETADIALMGDDLDRLPYLLLLARRSRRVIRQNIGVAILVKAVLAIGVPLGAVSLIAAVLIGDMGVSLAVIFNALRLGRVRA
jgi:Cd2+/Zn2+-exporting ATPase